MNIKRMSRVMVLALTLTTAASVVAMGGNDDNTNNNNTEPTRRERAMAWMRDAGTTAATWTRAHWYVPAGLGVTAGLVIWKYYYDKKVAKDAAKKKAEATKKAAEVTRQRQAQLRRQKQAARTRSVRRRCRGGFCSIR